MLRYMRVNARASNAGKIFIHKCIYSYCVHMIQLLYKEKRIEKKMKKKKTKRNVCVAHDVRTKIETASSNRNNNSNNECNRRNNYYSCGFSFFKIKKKKRFNWQKCISKLSTTIVIFPNEFNQSILV